MSSEGLLNPDADADADADAEADTDADGGDGCLSVDCLAALDNLRDWDPADPADPDPDECGAAAAPAPGGLVGVRSTGPAPALPLAH